MNKVYLEFKSLSDEYVFVGVENYLSKWNSWSKGLRGKEFYELRV